MRFAIAPALLLAAVCTACGHSQATPTTARVASNVAAHAVTRAGFQDLDGRPVSLASFAGHPVLLAFLNPTDSDSQAEAPLLIRLADAYQAAGLQVVVGGEHSNAAGLRAFAATAGLTFPVWQDPSGGQLLSHRLYSVPAFAFINRSGQDHSTHDGFASRGELTEGIEGIVNAR